MTEGTRVKWAGKQDPRLAPGFNGTVVKTFTHDENQIKVVWDERPAALGRYTFERRKNLQVIS